MDEIYETRNRIWLISILCVSVILAAVYIYKNCGGENYIQERLLNRTEFSFSSCDDKNSEVDSQASTVVV